MRAVTITKPGGLDVLTVTDRAVRPAGDGEVRIAVKAAAVNPTDILMRQNELRDLASSGAIKLRVAGEYAPERVAEAHRAMEAGGLRGRGVIVF